jgi:hypothetical protein
MCGSHKTYQVESHMKRLASLLAALLLFGCQITSTLESPDFAFIGVNVINIQSGEIAENQIVLIKGAKIVGVGPFANTIVPNDVETVFAQEQYLLPGLQSSKMIPETTFGGEIRTVSLNQPADLLLLDENPLQDIQALSRIAGVYSQAQWLDRDALDLVRQAAVELLKDSTLPTDTSDEDL